MVMVSSKSGLPLDSWFLPDSATHTSFGVGFGGRWDADAVTAAVRRAESSKAKVRCAWRRARAVWRGTMGVAWRCASGGCVPWCVCVGGVASSGVRCLLTGMPAVLSFAGDGDLRV
jgi:hypothetical protein